MSELAGRITLLTIAEHSARSTRFSLKAVVLLVPLCASALLVISAQAASGATSSHPARTFHVGGIASYGTRTVPGTNNLNGIACYKHLCVVVGSEGNKGVVVPITDGTPGTAEKVPGTVSLSAVSCPSSEFCVAVGYGYKTYPPEPRQAVGVVVSITDGTQNGAQIVVGDGEPGAPDFVHLNGVACESASSCIAGGSDTYLGAVIVPIVDGEAGSEQAVGNWTVNALACPNDSFCLMVGGNVNVPNNMAGTVEPIIDGEPQGYESVSESTDLGGVACSATNICVDVGTKWHGTTSKAVWSIFDESPGDASVVTGVEGLEGVACGGSARCVAVGYDSASGVLVPIIDSKAGASEPVSSTGVLNGVECTKGTCRAVGSNGDGVIVTFRLPNS